MIKELHSSILPNINEEVKIYVEMIKEYVINHEEIMKILATDARGYECKHILSKYFKDSKLKTICNKLINIPSNRNSFITSHYIKDKLLPDGKRESIIFNMGYDISRKTDDIINHLLDYVIDCDKPREDPDYELKKLHMGKLLTKYRKAVGFIVEGGFNIFKSDCNYKEVIKNVDGVAPDLFVKDDEFEINTDVESIIKNHPNTLTPLKDLPETLGIMCSLISLQLALIYSLIEFGFFKEVD